LSKKAIAQQLLQRIWAFGLMGKWFCIWMFSDNRKINLNLVPKPAVVPERYAKKLHGINKSVFYFPYWELLIIFVKNLNVESNCEKNIEGFLGSTFRL
jgi:hypothetical protein